MQVIHTVKYGLKSFLLLGALCVFLSILLFIFIGFEAFLFVLLYLVFQPFYHSLIYLQDDKLIFSPFLNPFWNKDIIPIEKIEKVTILSQSFPGKVIYTIHFKDGSNFETFNILLNSERLKLIQTLEEKGLEVIVFDIYS